MNQKYKSLAENTILFTVSSFSSRLLSFFLVPLYTNVLSTEEYGTADLITTTASVLGYIFTICISSAVLRFAIDEENKEGVLKYGIYILLKGTGFLSVIISILWYFDIIPWESYCYPFLFLFFVFPSLNEILSAYLRAIDNVKAVAISGLFATAITLVCNILTLLVLKIGVLGYLLSMILGSAVASLYCYCHIGKIHSEMCAESVKVDMRKYSIPLIFNGVAWWVSAAIDKYFVTGMIGTDANGIYSVAGKIPSIISTIQGIFMQAWGLSAIKEFDSHDKDGFFSDVFQIYNSGMIIICSGLILLNIPISRFLFAKDFFLAWKCSSILLISSLFTGLSAFEGSFFSAVKKNRAYAVSTIVAAFINIILNFVLIPIMNIVGAAIATAVSFGVVWIIRRYYAGKYIIHKNNLVKDCIAYLLLGIQIVAEHLDDHMYCMQIIIILLLVVMYHKTYTKIFKTIISSLSFLLNGKQKK